MEICNSILHNTGVASHKDFIELSYDERFLRRKKLTSYNGIEFLVDLKNTISLKKDDMFKLDSGLLINVRYKIEELLEIKGNNLMHLIWHIGNRHIPCQIEENRILIQNDKVIEEMILRLNGQTKVVLEAFDPEGGAYGIGRTHGHRH
jgi:urease accessory protein|tara:strand:+ start:1983 stop:2426 length:444 start_codon:yes stop_codon:yes gene_type:complete